MFIVIYDFSERNLNATPRVEPEQNNTRGTRAKRKRAKPVRNADARNPRVLLLLLVLIIIVVDV